MIKRLNIKKVLAVIYVINPLILINKNYKKVRDHYYYTGIYRGAAHSICNLRYQEQRDIPAIIHNGSNYDFHLLIKDLAKEFKSDMYCLSESSEKIYKLFC